MPKFNTSERLILLVLAAVQFTHIMDFMIMMPLGPQFMRDLGIGPGRFSALVAAYTITSGVVGLLAAPWVDRFDRRTLMLSAYGGFIVGTLACALSTTATQLMAARVISGAFGGLSGSLCLAIVSDVVPPERRAAGIGIIMTAFALAAALGVPVGLQLAQTFSWRAPFLLLVGLASTMLVAGYFALPPLRAHIAQSGARGQAFRELLRDGNAGRALLFMGMTVFGHFTIIPLLSPYLVSNVMLPEHDLFLVYLVGGIFSVLTAPTIGRMADKRGRLRVFSLLVVAAVVIIATVTNTGPLPVWQVLALSGLFFIFASGRFVPAQAIVTLAVPSSRRGAFMSLSSCARDLASGVSSSLGGWIVTTTPDGRLAHYNHLGWIAIGASVLSVWIGRSVRVNDSGAGLAGPRGPAQKDPGLPEPELAPV
jgi:predicted MFS family arabinose efflux permease